MSGLRQNSPAAKILATIAGSLLFVGALSACSTGPAEASPDVSPEGQIAYACALSHAVGDDGYNAPEDWDNATGPDTDPGAVAVFSIAALLGGANAGNFTSNTDLVEPAITLMQAAIRVDVEVITPALEDIQRECDDVDQGGANATQEGQVEYACALAARVHTANVDVEEWGTLLDDRTWQEIFTVSALVGAVNGAIVPGSEGLSEPAADIIRGVNMNDAEIAQEGLDTFVANCEE